MNEIPNNPFEKHVFVCVSGKTCPGQGSEEVLELLRKEIKELGLKSKIRINKSGCFDQCGHGPLVVVYPDNVWYARVKPSDCHEIIHSHLLNNQPVARLLYDRSGKIC
ncbi:MAG: (2Fe-2S) ferredoxin domain-containing protein [Candidatus Obscuribacterales bacterium]|nr:(2Fe-2S) ferredoxin domain-containing protein [Candidatus Obscuribacterales bacterium]